VKKQDSSSQNVKEIKKEEVGGSQCATPATENKPAAVNQSVIQPLFLDAEEMVEIGSSPLIDHPGLALRGNTPVSSYFGTAVQFDKRPTSTGLISIQSAYKCTFYCQTKAFFVQKFEFVDVVH